MMKKTIPKKLFIQFFYWTLYGMIALYLFFQVVPNLISSRSDAGVVLGAIMFVLIPLLTVFIIANAVWTRHNDNKETNR